MLVGPRLRAHASVFAAVFAVVAIIAGSATGLAGYLAQASTAGARASFAAATGADGAIRIDVRTGGDAQDSAVRAIVAEQFPRVPLLLDRTIESEPLTAEVEGESVRLVVAALPISERAELVDGTWPTNPGEAALQADAALSLGVGPGATVELPDATSLTITGTWVPLDPLDPIWFGESLAATGSTSDAVGPLVVDESVATGLRPFARWVVRPDPASVDTGDLSTIIDGAGTLAEALRASPDVATGNIIIAGGLADRASDLRRDADALSGITPVPAVLLAVLGLIALIELARLLVRVRHDETSVLRARGASTARITRDAALDAALVGAPAAALGTAVAQVVTGAGAWLIGGAVVVAVVLVFAVVALVDARRPLTRESVADSGRGRQVAGAGLIVLVLVATVVSVWQFRLYGSPIVRAADGRDVVDPIAVVAPTLALVAGALLVVVAFGPASTLVARLTARARIGWTLTGWQLARRVTAFATPVLLVALAVGGSVVAATYAATWDRATTIARELGNGAAVRVVSPDPIASVDGVEAMSPVLAAGLQIGDDPARLVALPASSIAAVVETAEGLVDPAALASAVAVPVGVPIPGTATALTVGPEEGEAGAADPVDPAAPTDSTGLSDVTMWLVGADGAARQLEAPYAIPDGQWSLASIQFGGSATTPVVVVATTPSGDVPLDVAGWAPASDLDGVIRLVPSETSRVPLVVSTSFADRGGLAVGDEVAVRFEGSGRRVVGALAAIVPVVPGAPSGPAILADLPALVAQQLARSVTVPSANETWIATDDPAAVAAKIAEPGVRVTTILSGPGDALLASGRDALWIGAIGSLVLAAAALGAIAGALLRNRAGEVVVLRAIGVPSRSQAAWRRRELTLSLAWAMVGGVLVGLGVSALVVAELAGSAVVGRGDAIPVDLVIDPALVALCGVPYALLLAAIVIVYGARVRTQARALSTREELG